MDAPSSPLSSLKRAGKVNSDSPRVNSAEERPRPPITLRKFMKLERRVRSYRPQHPRPPEKPDRADEVLDALAVAHQPGDRVGLEQIRAAAGVHSGIGSAVRIWARSEGRWPYQDLVVGFAANRLKVRTARTREGGDT